MAVIGSLFFKILWLPNTYRRKARLFTPAFKALYDPNPIHFPWHMLPLSLNAGPLPCCPRQPCSRSGLQTSTSACAPLCVHDSRCRILKFLYSFCISVIIIPRIRLYSPPPPPRQTQLTSLHTYVR